VQDGAWSIYDMSERYVIDNPDRSEHLIVMLPKACVAEPGLALAPLMARRLEGRRGMARETLKAMREVWGELPAMSGEVARGAGELLARLVRLTLLELAGTETDAARRAAVKDRIRLVVEQNLADPGLSVGSIARALDCSKRQLHKLFEDEDATLAAYIQRRRLQASMGALRVADDRRSLTEIALACGFTNMSHFSRAFHAHAGASPSAYRRAARPAPSP
jgi:AraC-like DNA-binding protein